MQLCNDPDVQCRLSAFYLRQIRSPESFTITQESWGEVMEIRALETAWESYELERLNQKDLPKPNQIFRDWYRNLLRQHRQKVTPFFDYMAEAANQGEIAYYMYLEEQVDERYDDVTALAQLGLTGDMKLALAENYWQSVSSNYQSVTSAAKLAESYQYLMTILKRAGINLQPEVGVDTLKMSNLMLMYALQRKYALKLLGALSILEHTAQYRFATTVQALRRVGAPRSVIKYYEQRLEAVEIRGDALMSRVLEPLAARNTNFAHEIALGTLIRYQISLDYHSSLTEQLASVFNFSRKQQSFTAEYSLN